VITTELPAPDPRSDPCANTDARLTPLPRLTIVPELALTGAFRDFLADNGGFGTTMDTSGQAGQGLIVKLTAAYQLTPKVWLYANATNIFASRFERVNDTRRPGQA
jgi:hypothetical protein